MNKIRMIVATLALLLATLGGATAVATPSNGSVVSSTAAPATNLTSAQRKGWPGGSVDYWRYYGGVVRYIILDCEGRYLSLYPGQWSKSIGCADVDGFFVQSGSKLFCGERYGLQDYVYYPGWHSIGNFAYRACEMRAHNG